MNRSITPFLWFDGNAEEAVNFYCSVFPDSEITRVTNKPDEPGAGSVLTIEFKVRGEEFIARYGRQCSTDQRPDRDCTGQVHPSA